MGKSIRWLMSKRDSSYPILQLEIVILQKDFLQTPRNSFVANGSSRIVDNFTNKFINDIFTIPAPIVLCKSQVFK